MGRGTSKASAGGGAKIDPYFKTDWEEGTGPDSASFENGLATGKRWMDRGYSYGELVEAVQSEYYLSDDETSVLDDKLRMFAIQHGKYNELHDDWKEDFKKRNIPITGKSTKVEMAVKNKWSRSKGGTYMLGDYRIQKTPSGRITKGFGYDVSKKGGLFTERKHFTYLSDAKKYVEGLIK